MGLVVGTVLVSIMFNVSKQFIRKNSVFFALKDVAQSLEQQTIVSDPIVLVMETQVTELVRLVYDGHWSTNTRVQLITDV